MKFFLKREFVLLLHYFSETQKNEVPKYRVCMLEQSGSRCGLTRCRCNTIISCPLAEPFNAFPASTVAGSFQPCQDMLLKLLPRRLWKQLLSLVLQYQQQISVQVSILLKFTLGNQ